MNQVAATVYSRFSSKKMPRGKTVYGVFTRDYRHDVMNCQVKTVTFQAHDEVFSHFSVKISAFRPFMQENCPVCYLFN